VGLEFVGDRRIRRLNQQYRRQDRPTDVLAFPMREAGGPYTPLLGDVVVSLHTAARQAAVDKRSVDDEVVTLLIHGILHLCGYKHERGGREARRMRRKERTILQSLGATPRLIVQRSTVSAWPSAKSPKLEANY
jgi:rRNA maturation RNase YbeY